MAERDVEARLAELGEGVDWPPAPDVRTAVRAGIARRRRRRLLLLVAAALAALALLGGAAAAASLELRGAVVQQVPSLPREAGGSLDLGVRQPSLAAGERAAGFRALVPAALGQPDEVWYRQAPGVLTLLYHPRPGLPASGRTGVGALVMEASATVGQTSFVKLAPAGSSVQPVTVGGGQGFWISGAPHAFFFYGDPAGGRTDSFRLAGDVLIWNQGGLVVRIESALDERGALRIAGTMAPGPVYLRHEVVPRVCRDRRPAGCGLRRRAGGAAVDTAAAGARGRRPGVRPATGAPVLLGDRRPDRRRRPDPAGGDAVA
ncbi:MAG: hypothetical protein E6J41_13990 [Chloroflexi bacterium]|nr:MAG: hypothetical protein E6J41_13990 [Chloroflexota bacterium]